MPLTGAAQKLKQCQHCYKSDTKDAPLLSCSQCKRAHYCSRECQTADWQNHKAMCKINRDTRDLMKEDSRPFNVAEVEARMKKWVQYFRPVLYAAASNALRLKDSPQTCRTHALFVKLSPAFDLATGIPNSEKQLRRAFRLEDAYTIPISELVESRPELDLPIQAALERATMPGPHNLENVDIMIVILLVSEISVMRMVPLGMHGSNDGLLPWDRQWKATMRNALEHGVLL